MKPEEFVSSLKAYVVDENVDLYAETFRSTDRNRVSDEYWRAVLALFDSLDDESKDLLLRIIKQVAVDTVSNVLGVLDGSSYHSASGEELTLLDATRTKLNGNLQDLFMESEENR